MDEEFALREVSYQPVHVRVSPSLNARQRQEEPFSQQLLGTLPNSCHTEVCDIPTKSTNVDSPPKLF